MSVTGAWCCPLCKEDEADASVVVKVGIDGLYPVSVNINDDCAASTGA